MHKLDIGGAISRGFSTFFDNFGRVFSVAVSFGLVTYTILFLGLQYSFRDEALVDTLQNIEIDWVPVAATVIATMAVSIAGYIVLILLARDLLLERDKRPVGELLAAVPALMLPLVGLSIVIGLGVGVAAWLPVRLASGLDLGYVALLFLLPGLYLYVRWRLAYFALIVDRMGIFASAGRSWKQSSGRWWALFAAVLVADIGLVFGGALVTSVLGSIVGDSVVATIVLQGIAFAIVTPIGLLILMDAYLQLAGAPEDAATEPSAGHVVPGNPPTA